MTPERFLEVADLFADPALLLARDGTVLAANRAVATLGWSPPALAGRRLSELAATPPAQIDELLRLSARSRDPVPGSLALRGVDGDSTPCRCRSARAGGPEEEPRIVLRCTPSATSPSRFAVLNQKIAQLSEEIRRRQAVETRLQEQSEWLQVTLASIGDAILTADETARVTFLNPVAERLTGWSLAEARGRRLGEVFPIIGERTRRPAPNPIDRVLEEGGVVGLANSTLLIRRDGEEVPIEDSAAPIRNGAGEVAGVVLVFRDATERKRAEAALAESEQKFRLLADTIPQLAWMARADGHVSWYNRRWYEFTGTTPEQMAGWGWQAVHDPERLPEVLERWKTSIATGEPLDMVFPLRGADGHFRPFLTRVNPLRDDGGRILYWFGTNTDISEQKRAEDSSRFLAEASAALAAVGDADGTLQKVAWLAVPRFGDWCTIHRIEADGTLRRVAVAHLDPDKLERARRLKETLAPDPAAPLGPLRVAQTGEPELFEEVSDELLRAAAGSDHAVALRELGLTSYISVPMRASGRMLGVITFHAGESPRRYRKGDLTLAQGLADRAAVALENARLYGELLDADRRKDEFLATLAHELRNPLAPIRNALQILEAAGTTPGVAQRTREMMERQVQHLVRLVDDLLDVSRVMRGKVELQRERTDLAEVVAHAVETVQPVVDAQRQQLTIEVPDPPVEIEGDPVRLTQVVANLLANAAKYTPAEGSIRLTLAVDDGAGSAVIRVRDDGVGIAPEMLSKVFDLFVQAESSVARSGGGLGIGLTLVRSLVTLHGGTVDAHSEGTGTGSEFVVRLPLAGAAGGTGSEATRETGSATVSRPRRRVLVVDDNVDAAESLATLLRLSGNDVWVAHGGAAALELAREHPPEIVLLDLGMPRMDGFEVARRLRRDVPEGMLLVALTGWGQEEDRRRTADAGFDLHLVKPVEPGTLEELLVHPKLSGSGS